MKIALSFVTLTIIMLNAASAAPDDCTATQVERADHLGRMMIGELDRGGGPLRHPAWLYAILADPDAHDEQIAQFCAASPDFTLSTAVERIYAPQPARK